MTPESNEATCPTFGQQQAAQLESIFKAHYRVLVNYATGIVHHSAEAEDIVVNLFVRLMDSQAPYDSPEGLRKYLYRATRNACIDHLRKESTRMRSLQELGYLQDTVLETVQRETAIIAGEVLHALNEEINNLPAQCRQVFSLLYFNKMDLQQVAHHMGVTVKTVCNQKSKALTSLRSALLSRQVAAAFELLLLFFICIK